MSLTKIQNAMLVNDLTDYGNDFATAVSEIGSTEVKLTVTQTPNSITSNTTIPSNIHLDWAAGCPVTIASGITLTISGSLSAGGYEIFSGDGIINYTQSGNILWFGDTLFNSIPSYNLYGNGWHKVDYATKATGTVLTTTDTLNFDADGSLERGFSLKDFAVDYSGTGSAIEITGLIQTDYSNLHIECNNTGANGIVFNSYSFFSNIHDTVINAFTDVGILLNTGGTKTVVRDCSIQSGVGGDAVAALEVRDAGTSVYDGQINVSNVAGDGIGVLFNNTGSTTLVGGLVNGTLFEDNTGVVVSGTTHGWSSIMISNTRHTLGSGQTGVVFQRASYCTMLYPEVASPTGGTVIEFGANAYGCGLIGDYNACRAGITVSPSATSCFSICKSPLLYSERATITTNSNLKVICEDVQYVGKTIHNGTGWDKYSESVATDAVTSFTPPSLLGQVSIRTTNGSSEAAIASYDVSSGAMTSLLTGATVSINATDGVLTGTTGSSGYITLRCDSSSGKLYVENRKASSRRIIVEFK